MSDLDEMKRLLAHLKARHKLGPKAKPEAYAKLVMSLAAEAAEGRLDERLKLPKYLQELISRIAHEHHVIGGAVEIAFKANGYGRLNSAFETWFTAQFGPPPFSDPIAEEEAKEEIRGLEMRLGELKRRVEHQREYVEHERAALYAWQARGSSPKGLAKARPRARGVR